MSSFLSTKYLKLRSARLESIVSDRFCGTCGRGERANPLHHAETSHRRRAASGFLIAKLHAISRAR